MGGVIFGNSLRVAATRGIAMRMRGAVVDTRLRYSKLVLD